MPKYRARADITVNGNVITAGNTFTATPQDAQGFIINGQAEAVDAKEPAAKEGKSRRKK